MYKGAFKRYANFTGLTATQLIDEAIEDLKKDPRERTDIVLTRLISFYNWLTTEALVRSRGRLPKGVKEHEVVKKGISEKLAIVYVNCIRSFYATYDIVVRFKGRHRLPKPQVRNKRMIVSAEQVKTLVDHARTPRDRAIILTMFQGGMDVSTLCSLKYGDVAKGLAKKEHPLKLEIHRPKTGVEYYTFLGKDAIEAIRAYVRDVKRRGIKFNNVSLLFVKERRVKQNGKKLKVEGLKTNAIQKMFREVAIKAGFVDEKMNGKDFNPLGPHALRESFGSIMTNSGVPDTIVDFWLGHSVGEMAKAYQSVQYESLKKLYLKREKLLSISQSMMDIEELEKRVEKRVRLEIDESRKQLQKIVNGLSAENLEMRQRIKKLEEFKDWIGNRLERLDKTEKYIRSLRTWLDKEVKFYQQNGIMITYSGEMSKRELHEIIEEAKKQAK